MKKKKKKKVLSEIQHTVFSARLKEAEEEEKVLRDCCDIGFILAAVKATSVSQLWRDPVWSFHEAAGHKSRQLHHHYRTE